MAFAVLMGVSLALVAYISVLLRRCELLEGKLKIVEEEYYKLFREGVSKAVSEETIRLSTEELKRQFARAAVKRGE